MKKIIIIIINVWLLVDENILENQEIIEILEAGLSSIFLQIQKNTGWQMTPTDLEKKFAEENILDASDSLWKTSITGTLKPHN